MSDTITVTGNIATEPDYKRTPAGLSITSFRVASSQRRFDRATGAWVDGETNYYRVSTFRGLAEHAFASFKKGDRVLLTGRLRLRHWEAGDKRGTAVEIDAEAIGHDLLWGTTTFHRAARDGNQTSPAIEGPDPWHADAAQTPATVSDDVPGAWNVPGEHAPTQSDFDSAREGGEQRALVAAASEVPF